jgi:hypothetical protein
MSSVMGGCSGMFLQITERHPSKCLILIVFPFLAAFALAMARLEHAKCRFAVAADWGATRTDGFSAGGTEEI